MKVPKQLCDVLERMPTAEQWRDNLGLSRIQYGRLRYYTLDPKELQSSTLRAVHACGAAYDHPHGTMVVSVGDAFQLRYISDNPHTSDFVYSHDDHGEQFRLKPRLLPQFTMINDQYMMSSCFEDVVAHYGDVCGVDINGVAITYHKDGTLLMRDEWLPSFRCKPFYGEKEFRDMVFEKNLKGFRPSFANLF